jgi:2-keto-4-pentenoate hydratase
MALGEQEKKALAEALYQAEVERKPIAPLTDTHPDLTPQEAYAIQLVGMVLEKNGEVVFTGAGAAALGNPATSVAWLANKLAEFGLGLGAGEVILSGSLAGAPAVTRGDLVEVHFGQLGSVSVRFV